MGDYAFAKKKLVSEMSPGASGGSYDMLIEKPLVCPLCGERNDPAPKENHVFAAAHNKPYITIKYQCNTCLGIFLSTYDVDLNAKSATFGSFHPTLSVSYENQHLQDVSPRFIEVYKQSLTADNSGHFALAAIGYRSAVEFLIKDYLVKFRDVAEKDVVKLSLFDAAGKYLPQEMVNTADVVRILGRDYVHYDVRHPDIDFSVLRDYTKLIIDQIALAVRVSNPPVARPSGQSPQANDHPDSNTE